MTILPLIQNNPCHCVWNRQSAETTVLEAVLLYSEMPYSAESAPPNQLIFVCPRLMGKAVAFRAWKNLSFLIPDLSAKIGSRAAECFYNTSFGKGFLDCDWVRHRITSMIPCPIVTAVDENSQGTAIFVSNLCRGWFIHCLSRSASPKSCLLSIPVSPFTFLNDTTNFSVPVCNV